MDRREGALHHAGQPYRRLWSPRLDHHPPGAVLGAAEPRRRAAAALPRPDLLPDDDHARGKFPPLCPSGGGQCGSGCGGPRGHFLAPLQVIALIALYTLRGGAEGKRGVLARCSHPSCSSHKRLGGVTGDVLGAIGSSQSAAMVALLSPCMKWAWGNTGKRKGTDDGYCVLGFGGSSSRDLDQRGRTTGIRRSGTTRDERTTINSCALESRFSCHGLRLSISGQSSHRWGRWRGA